MSLQPRTATFQIPEETQRVARAAFPRSTLCLQIGGRPNSRVTNRHLEGHSAEFGEKQYVKDLESF